MEVLLTQLAVSKARVFVGTMFSTFTSLIDRMRGFAGQEPNFLYCYNDFVSPELRALRALRVSAGRLADLFPGTGSAILLLQVSSSWFREWPESFDTSGPSAQEAPPFGTLDLRAGAATLHGSTLRIMPEVGAEPGGEPVIVDPGDRCGRVRGLGPRPRRRWNLRRRDTLRLSREVLRYPLPCRHRGRR